MRAPRSYTPVELAVFLLGAGPYSYFSYSLRWNFGDFPWLPQYDVPLGAPLGPPVRTNKTTPLPAWEAMNATNVVCGLIPAPGHSGARFAFLGNQGSAAACAAAARANASFATWTWVGSDGGDWRFGCYARLDAPPADCLAPGAGGGCGAPCYTDTEPGTVSAVDFAVNVTSALWTRDFEHLHVEWEPGPYSARMTPQ